jgi:HEAT repeat protein
MSDPFTEFLGAIAAGEDTRTDQAALALARRGDAALPSLHELLRDADPERRWWAARAMAAVGTESARTLLIVALGDPDAYVRACAAHGLGEPGGGLEKAVPPLVRSLADVSPLVSRVAADSLARIGSPAVPALIAALEAEGASVRAGAARALCIIQPEEAVPALCAALDDPSAAVTYYAEEALERLGVGLVLFQP